MTNDLDLLEQYTRQKSEEAFAALVNRHLDLVYSAALRQVRSREQAEEIAQSVFADLARSADKLKPDTILTAWLYQVTRRTAVEVIRRESRRQFRERIAVEMTAMNSTALEWTQIEPLLDEAMHVLDDTDRAAVLLRYFENKSLREVGATLGTSDDAAQKRVSRAVEHLREFFAKRGVTVGASGLVVVISANAVQAAPVGLAVTISTAAALAGTTITTTATATATKAIAMTTLQKSIVTATIAVLAGAGIYEARQASQLRDQVQTLQQQQAPLADQIQQAQRERDDAKRQLAALRGENERLNRNTSELLKLRGEVSRLKGDAQTSKQEDASANSLNAAAKSWLKRVDQLKQYVEQHPKEGMPEFQFLTDREWLAVADAGLPTDSFQNEDEYDHAMQSLRFQAESRFANSVIKALRDYSTANDRSFPTDISQLQPYCDSAVENMLIQFYKIAPASIVHDAPLKAANGVTMSADVPHHILGDWVITRKVRTNPNSTSRLAIFTGGTTYWQSPPGRDDK